MAEPLDPTTVDVEHDESVVALIDAMAELDAEDELYPVDDADLVEAHERALLVFERAEAEERDAFQELVAEVLVTEVESWLADSPVEAVLSRGAMAVPTLDRSVPALTTVGYAPEVEIDAEVDSTRRSAEVSVTMTPVTDAPARLVVRVIAGDGTVCSAQVNRYGLAVASQVPIDEATPLRITWVLRK